MACASEASALARRRPAIVSIVIRLLDSGEPPVPTRCSRMRPSASAFRACSFTTHMPHPARYVRPKRPVRGLALQTRDLAILDAIRRYRALRAEHLSALLGPIGRRVLQARLRLLWEHRLLDRRYLPALWGGDMPPVASQTPLYLSTARGLRRLVDARGLPQRDERVELPSVFTLAHDMVAVDFLVALECAAKTAGHAVRVTIQPEHLLRRELAESAARPRDGKQLIVPDGAATIAGVAGDASTLHLEIVRAGARSGNGRIAKKLVRYGELLRDGFFERAYGHARLRAVLIATTSERRAETLRELTEARLPKPTHWLFWFGSFSDHAAPARFLPWSVLEIPWKRTDGRKATLAPLLAEPMAPSATAPP